MLPRVKQTRASTRARLRGDCSHLAAKPSVRAVPYPVLVIAKTAETFCSPLLLLIRREPLWSSLADYYWELDGLAGFRLAALQLARGFLLRSATNISWRFFEQDDRVRYGRVFRPHPFRSFRFHANLISGNAQQFRDALADCLRMWTNLRLRKNQSGIHVGNSVSRSLDSTKCLLKKHGGVGAFPTRIGRRKKCANVGCANPAEQSVGDGVEQYVSIRMTAQSF